MKRIAVLGSTGSIGTQTLSVVADNASDMKITALAAAGNRLDLLEEQVLRFKPEIVGIYDENAAKAFKTRISGISDCKVVAGMEGLVEIAVLPHTDVVVTAFVGMMGIRPTVAAIRAHKDIALANKETLVTAGHIIMPLAQKEGVSILPVDSEHSAIFQCLHKEPSKDQLRRILLTASGGPFRTYTKEQMQHITVADALAHPNWSMGAKITIDSSTMVNKGLEVMEAHWLFDATYDQIEVVVQPQSIIHSMVEFNDGAVIAQLGTPDMRLPILYALTYPNRRPLNGEYLDFTKLKQITFEAPSFERFPALKLAYEIGRKGGNAPTVFNAANEVAVADFLANKIRYTDIYETIARAVDTVPYIADASLDDIFETERKTRRLCALHV